MVGDVVEPLSVPPDGAPSDVGEVGSEMIVDKHFIVVQLKVV